MNNDKLVKIIELKIAIEKVTTKKEELEIKIQELANSEIIKSYLEIIDEIEKMDEFIQSKNKLIAYIDKSDCRNNNHSGLLYLAPFCNSIRCLCLNCGKEVYIKTDNEDLEKNYILNFRNFFEYPDLIKIIPELTEKYHLLRDCYYKYPRILKETENKDKMIYKAMLKKYKSR